MGGTWNCSSPPTGSRRPSSSPGPLAAPTYLDRFALPAGVGARQGDQGVEFTDAAGKVVATFGGGFAFDATFPAGGADTSAPVTTRLVTAPSAADASATVKVSVDAAWLVKPGRAFPVKVDPSFWQNTSSGQGRETYVTSGPWANSSFGTSTAVVSGADPSYYVSRTLIWFNLGALPSATRVVTSAGMGVYNWYSPSCSARSTDVYGLGGAFADTTTWNTQPPLDAAGLVTSSSFAQGSSGCVMDWANFDITTLARRWVTDGAANYGLELRASNEADPAAIRYYDVRHEVARREWACRKEVG